MTITLILAIGAMVMFSAFCIICLYALKKNREETREHRKETREYGKHISAMEKSLDKMGGLLSECNAKIEQQKPAETPESAETPAKKDSSIVIEELDEIYDEDEEEILLEDLISEENEIAKSPEGNLKKEGLETEERTVSSPEGKAQEVDIEAFIRSFKDMEAKANIIGTTDNKTIEDISSEPPHRQRMEYDRAKSGKRYTVSELDRLIVE